MGLELSLLFLATPVDWRGIVNMYVVCGYTLDRIGSWKNHVKGLGPLERISPKSFNGGY
jgi:hypothetical protein